MILHIGWNAKYVRPIVVQCAVKYQEFHAPNSTLAVPFCFCFFFG